MHHAFAMLQGQGQVLAQRGLVAGLDLQAGDGQLDGVLFEAVDARETGGGQKVAIHPQMGVAPRARPIGQLGVDAFAVDHQGAEKPNVLAPIGFHQLGNDALGRLRLHRRAVVHAVLGAQLDVEQAQEMPHLGGGAHRAFAPTARQALLDGHRGRDAIHRVHLGAASGLHDAARISVQAFQIAALAFVEQNVKGQGGLARAAHAGDDVELPTRDVHAQVAQVVLAGVDDADAFFQRLAQVFGRWLLHQTQGQAAGCGRGVGIAQGRGVCARGEHLAHGLCVFAQGARGVRAGVLAHLFGVALDHHATASVTAFGPQVNQPVAGADHVQVVFDDDQRMPGLQQAAQGAHEFGDVVKVQPGGGLVKQKQGAFARQRLTAVARRLGGLGQEPGQFQALGLATTQGGHGLAQAHIFQTDFNNRLQSAQHIAVLRKQLDGFADRQIQQVGYIQKAPTALDLDLQHLGPKTLAIAVGATQVNVAQKLHLHMLKARAATGRATPVAAVGAEL